MYLVCRFYKKVHVLIFWPPVMVPWSCTLGAMESRQIENKGPKLILGLCPVCWCVMCRYCGVLRLLRGVCCDMCMISSLSLVSVMGLPANRVMHSLALYCTVQLHHAVCC